MISAFIASSFITIAIAYTSLLLGIIRGFEDNAIDEWVFKQLQKSSRLRAREDRTEFWQPIMESLVLALSDQQLLVGISILIAGFLKHCTISVYHFSIVNDLAWFSSNTHMTTLTVLRAYFLNRPQLRDWRVCLMMITLLLLLSSTILEGHKDWYESWNSPAQCLFNDLQGHVSGEPAFWMAFGMLLLMTGYSVTITRLYDRTWLEDLAFHKPISGMERVCDAIESRRSMYSSARNYRSIFGSLMLLPPQTIVWVTMKIYKAAFIFADSTTTSLLFDVAWFAYGLWSIIEDRDMPAAEMSGNENEWGFGQIVPVLLLSSTVLTFKELYTGKQALCLLFVYCISIELTLNNEDRLSKIREHALKTMNNSKGPGGVSSEANSNISKDDLSMDAISGSANPAYFSPRRADTEAGGHGAATGFELQRRSTQRSIAGTISP